MRTIRYRGAVYKNIVDVPPVVFHYCTEGKLRSILKLDKIVPRWQHYIESENTLVKGTSATWLNDHISTKYQPIKLSLDTEKIHNDYYLINSNRTYLQTKALLDKRYDPEAYKYESEDPNEMFIVDVIQPLHDCLLDIQVVQKNIDVKTMDIIEQYRRKYNLTEKKTASAVRYCGAVYRLASPADSFIQQADAITVRGAVVDIMLSKMQDSIVMIDDLSVSPARRGYGTKFMRALIGLADRLDVDLFLRVANETDDWNDDADFPSEDELITWYSRFGFAVESASGWGFVMRRPHV